MIELGKKQKLLVVKTVDFGIYLGEDRNAPQNERVLLPSKQVPEGTKAGDELEVFIYRFPGQTDRHNKRADAPGWTDSCSQGETGHKNRSIPRLGTGEGSSSSVP